MTKAHGFATVFIIMGTIIVLFVVVPILGIGIATPIRSLIETARDTEVISSIRLTFISGLCATIFAVIFGTPLAYTLARYSFPMREIVESIIDLPVVIPHSAAGIALLTVLGRNSAIGHTFSVLGIHFTGTSIGIATAMAFVSIPFYVNAAKEGFASVDRRLEKTAYTLGASRSRTFFSLTLPLAKNHLVSGAIMMWARGISEFGAIVILAYHPMVAPVLVYERFESFGLAYSRPVAWLIILISLVAFTTLRFITRRRRD